MDVAALDLDAARALAAELQAALQAREVQLERKFQEVASMQDLTQQLMVRPTSSSLPYRPPSSLSTTSEVWLCELMSGWAPFVDRNCLLITTWAWDFKYHYIFTGRCM